MIKATVTQSWEFTRPIVLQILGMLELDTTLRIPHSSSQLSCHIRTT